MSSSNDSAEPDTAVPEQPDTAALYWMAEFRLRGMVEAQAERLAYTPGVDRHAVRDALERGCDPDLAFLIWSCELP